MAATINRIIHKFSDEPLSTIKVDTSLGGSQELSLGELLVSFEVGEEAVCFLNSEGQSIAVRPLNFSLTSPVSGQFLRYDGTDWVNSVIQVGDLPDLSSLYATAAQGNLADSALQSGDTVSSLINDSQYIPSDNSTIFGADRITNIVSLTEAEYLVISPEPSTLYVLT